MTLLPQCLSRRILTTPLSSTPPPHYNTTIRTATRRTMIPISICSRFHHIPPPAHHFLVFNSSAKPTSDCSPFSLCISGCRSISKATAAPPVNHGYDEEKETSDSSKLRILKQKVEGLEINCDSYEPGQYEVLVCPKCKGGQSLDRGLSFHISENGDFATWKCSFVECGWAGQVLAEDIASCNRVKVNCTGLMTMESLRLVPVGEKLISYFAERKISEDVLQRNAVMQISGNQNAIAFTYRRNEVLVTCKYRSLDKKFWQEKCKERIFYGLDDIKGADEIIIVEGEIDKLSMEESGFLNCVSVPDGAPVKVSAKLPLLEKDSRFQYLWNCKEHLDKASRIILATDGDPPGNALAEELAHRLGRERCWRVRWPKKGGFSCYKDANEVLMNLGSAALRDVVHSAELYSMHN
ncbi:primase homolog protein-like isoform X2 [Rhododendron vialii]|uniref:primase homolog protein-like isoform X2 n=1 Tax=Rhododendron vialii TaxID=182163 RepID=UPI00265FE1BA|nr:primase homolog protein-like isoform X2 [Rhododendron vialii]